LLFHKIVLYLQIRVVKVRA